jgi:hypothetical protein
MPAQGVAMSLISSGEKLGDLARRKRKRRSVAALILLAVAGVAISAKPHVSFLSSAKSWVPSDRVLSLGGNRSPQGELPAAAILIALGHDSKAVSLQRFADHVKMQLGRRVVTYRQFEEVRYTSETGRWWNRLPFVQTTNVVKRAIRRAIDRCPNCRIIAFNLDGYDPNELFDSNGKEAVSYTNSEVRFLLSERRFFIATRWYRNQRELPLEEAEKFWAPVFALLRSKRCADLLETVGE